MREQSDISKVVNQLPLSFRGVTKSIESKSITVFLAGLITIHVGGVKAPSCRLQSAVTALISDLLECAFTDRDAVRYRSMGSVSFVGECIGYRAFIDAYDTLVAHGFVQAFPGKKGGLGGVGTATRLRATHKLIALAASYGIELEQLSDHFGIAPPPVAIKEPVVMRAPATKRGKLRHQGAKLKLDVTHPGIVSDINRINRINAYLSAVNIVGIECRSIRRIYCNHDDDKKYGRYGGRLYSPFQNMQREDRRSIRINGEPTCEVDISGSFLTIYNSLLGKPLDTSLDPYAGIPLPRPIVKAYINAAFGHGRFHSRWPADVVDGLENPDDPAAERFTDVAATYPILRVRMAVENYFPALIGMDEGQISAGK